MGRVILNADKVRIYRNIFRYSGYTHEVLDYPIEKAKRLPILLKHYNNQSIKEYLDYQGVLTTREVDNMVSANTLLSKSKLFWLLLYRPTRAFIMFYIYFRLFSKGLPGIFWSLLSANHEVIILAKYYERVYVKPSQSI